MQANFLLLVDLLSPESSWFCTKWAIIVDLLLQRKSQIVHDKASCFWDTSSMKESSFEDTSFFFRFSWVSLCLFNKYFFLNCFWQISQAGKILESSSWDEFVSCLVPLAGVDNFETQMEFDWDSPSLKQEKWLKFIRVLQGWYLLTMITYSRS